ncbi:hypothetical protein LTR37_008415 [Vermiconidia calcicola]|uniref:Uncharacterized protein n=1 Tax=Vermiconidia calcicola TaxID=1690605 RepID=A0ACC3NAW0_9PEZI|nr:hypothetical protein LTR37_008415 [Vermiconidia calcicola]
MDLTKEAKEAAATNQPNMLQKLPAELRSYIYELAFTGPDGTNVLVIDGFQRKNIVQPSLTMTGKQVRDESLSIYYVKTIFQLDLWCGGCLEEDMEGGKSAQEWLSVLGPLYRSQLGLAIVSPGAAGHLWKARFRSIDQRLVVGPPSKEAREALRAPLAGTRMTNNEIDKWVGKLVQVTFK